MDPAYSQLELDEVGHILGKLPSSGNDRAWLDGMEGELQGQLDAIKVALSQRVLKSYAEFVEGMAQISELKEDLSLSAQLCKNTRRGLADTRARCVDSPLRLMSLHRRLKLLEAIVATLEGFSRLLDKEQEFYRLIDSGEYPAALAVLAQCKRKLKRYSQFPALGALRQNLEGGVELLERKMEETLFQICHVFTVTNFDRVMEGYATLGKTGVVLEKLPKSFLGSLKNSMLDVLFSWVVQSAGAKDPAKLRRLKFQDLVVHLSGEFLEPCLRHVFEIASDILANHRAICARLDHLRRNSQDHAFQVCIADVADRFASVRQDSWTKLQRRVIHILRVSDNVKLKQASFLNILSLVHSFTAIGESFCGEEASLLRTEIAAKCKNFVKVSHRETLEGMRSVFENEMWSPFPLAENFSLKDIKELRPAAKAVVDAAHFDLGGVAKDAAAVAATASVSANSLATVSAGSLGSTSSNNNNNNNGDGNAGSGSGAAAAAAGGGGGGEGGAPSGPPDALARYMAGYNPFKVIEVEPEDSGKDGATASALAAAQAEADGVGSGAGGNAGGGGAGGEDADDDDDVAEELKADFIDEDGSGKPQKASALSTSITEARARAQAAIAASRELLKGGAQSAGRAALLARAQQKSREQQQRAERDRQQQQLRAERAQQDHLVPIMTTSSLYVIRAIGRYLNLAEVLPSNASQIIENLKRVVEYYAFVVFSNFSKVPREDSTMQPSARLKAALLGIQAYLRSGREQFKFLKWEQDAAQAVVNATVSAAAALGLASGDHQPDADRLARVTNFLSSLDLGNQKTFFGLAQRAVGVESLRFVAEVLRYVRPRMEASLQAWENSALSQQFFGVTINQGIPDLCSFVYENISKCVVSLERIPDAIAATKWDRDDIGSKANAYVSSLLDSYRQLAVHLEKLDLTTIPAQARLDIWRSAVAVGMDALVEGYSRVKKCSTGGRSAMAIDLKFFQGELEGLTPIRPLPHLANVDNYIKAFYIPDSESFIEFLTQNHGEFTSKQLKALVEVGLGRNLTKLQKEKLFDKIDELDQAQKKFVTIRAFDSAAKPAK
jgi:hypothetical protein